jgi:type I restriction enzyme S subunit
MENSLPKGWIETSLEELQTQVIGGDWGKDLNEASDDYTTSKVIRGTDFKNWQGNKTRNTAIRKIKKSSLEKRQLKCGDIVIEVSGGGPDQPVGRTIIIDEKLFAEEALPLVCSNFFRKVTLSKFINPYYVNYYLNHAYLEGAFNDIQTHTTNLRNLRVDQYLNSKVLLPPLSEQHRIVGKLDALLARVANCKNRLEKIPALLKNFRQSVLATAVSGELTKEWRKENKEQNSDRLLKEIFEFKRRWAESESKKDNGEAKRLIARLKNGIKRCTTESLPESWSFQTLLDVCHLVVDCHNKTAPYTDKGIYLVRTTNIKNGKIVLDDIRFVNEDTYAFWSRRCPPKSGDILFTREAPMGEAAIIPDGMKICLGQRTMLLRMPAELLENKFVLYTLLAPSMLQQINENAIGSGVKHLRVGDVENLQIPIPPLEEQKEIVRRVEELFHFADSIEARYQKAKAWFNKLPQAILAKAFRGELAEQDENDEPANVLLERIKKEKQNTNKPQPTAKRKKVYEENEGVSLAAEE